MGFPQPQPNVVQQPLNLNPERTGNNQMGRPVPLLYGLHKTGVFWMTDIFSERRETVTQRVQTGKNSSEDVETGVNYYGSWLAGIGYVNNLQLLQIWDGDTLKWSGDIRAGTSVQDWTVGIGENNPITVYTGNQTRSDLFARTFHNPNHPAYKGLAYYRVANLLYGQSPQPPNYEFSFRSIVKVLPLDSSNTSGDPRLDSDSAHYINDGCLIPEIIYDILTNERYGLNKSIEEIDTQSFIDASITCREEGVGYSAKFRERKFFDSGVKQMMSLIDAEWIDIEGRIGIKLNRATDAITTIPESVFLDSPKITTASWHDDNIVNEVRIPYSPFERALEPTVAKASDQASIERVGMRSKSYSFDGIRNQNVAQEVANRFVKILSVPRVSYSFKLSSDYDFLRKGQRIAPIFDKKRLRGNTILRIQDVTFGSSKSPYVTIKAETDHSRLLTQLGDLDEIVTREEIDPQSASMRLLYLTESQRGDFSDGFVAGISRATDREDGAVLSTSGNGADYDLIASQRSFSLQCEILEWSSYVDDLISLRIKFVNEHEERSFLENAQDGLPEWTMLLSLSDGNGVNSMSPVWAVIESRFALDIIDDGNGGFEYGITVKTGQFSSATLSEELDKYPSRTAFLAPYSNFFLYRTNQFRFERNEGNFLNDTQLERSVLCSTSFNGRRQEFEDSTIQTFNRSTGIQSESWGGIPPNYGGLAFLLTGQNGVAPSDVSLEINGSGTVDVEVNWGAGQTVSLSAQQLPLTLNHTYQGAGDYEIQVNTESGGLETMRQFNVSLSYNPLLITSSDLNINAGENVDITFSNGSTFDAVIDWGDSSDTILTSESTPRTESHTFPIAGDYTINITGTDLFTNTPFSETFNVVVS